MSRLYAVQTVPNLRLSPKGPRKNRTRSEELASPVGIGRQNGRFRDSFQGPAQEARPQAQLLRGSSPKRRTRSLLQVTFSQNRGSFGSSHVRRLAEAQPAL